ncbi:hypothetical protein IKZ40_07000 [bacterium]|nr:hypothetical protein [bacterium]
MERKTFSQVLKDTSFNWKKEYERLYYIFYKESHHVDITDYCTIREFISKSFKKITLRDTCLTLSDYDSVHKKCFGESVPANADVDYLLSFCEYSYNLVCGARDANDSKIPYRWRERMKEPLDLYIKQVLTVIEKMGYMCNEKEGETHIVPKSQAAISVSEILNQDLSSLLLEYNHNSMKGNLEGKRRVLESLAIELENYETKLEHISKALRSDIGFLLNTLNIRHNNIGKDSKNYKKAVANMSDEEREYWYDETYQTLLLVFLKINHVERKKRMSELKKSL